MCAVPHTRQITTKLPRSSYTHHIRGPPDTRRRRGPAPEVERTISSPSLLAEALAPSLHKRLGHTAASVEVVAMAHSGAGQLVHSSRMWSPVHRAPSAQSKYLDMTSHPWLRDEITEHHQKKWRSTRTPQDATAVASPDPGNGFRH